MKAKSTLQLLPAIVGFSLLAIYSASAQNTYYWDGNNNTDGFGTAGGTWAAPTAGTATSGWSTSSTGVTVVDGNSVTTTTADTLNFGTNTALYGLAAGTISVSGTVNAGNVTFGSQSGSITLSGGTINLASTATINASSTMTIDSLITGAGTSLTKAGGGTLRLTNLANTYTGATLIGQSTGGVLEATFLADGGVASSIGASSSAAGNLVLSNINAGVLRYIGTANASSDRLFTLGNQQGYAGGFEVTGTGTLNLTNTGSVAFAQANAGRIFSLGGSHTGQNTLSALLIDNGTGALSFIKNGAGNWVLANNSNSYTGSTTINNAGTLSISKMANYGTVSAIGKGTAGTGIIFNGGALNYIGSGDDTDRLIQLTTNGTILNNGTSSLNFTATGNFNVQASSNSARTLSLGGTNGGTISGAIQNNTGTGPAINLTKIGTGTWTLNAQNTYTGNTDVNAGTLRLQSGTTTITQTLGALRSQVADGTLNSDKAGSGSLTTTFSSYARAAGATGNITITGGTNGTDNSVNITGTAGFIDKGLFFGGSEFASRSTTNGFLRALNYATSGGDANTVDVNTVTASRHVKLNASASSFSGVGVTLLSLNLQGDNVNWTNTSGTLVAPGILKSGGGSSTISGGNVNAGSNAELVVRTDLANDNLTINSVLNLGNTSGILTKSGAGTLTLGGNNTYQGQTHVNAGTLSIGANVNLGDQATGATLNLKGGTLQATGTFGLFNGTAGTNNRAVTLLDQSGIEVTGSNTLTIAGVISNNASAGVTRPGFNKTGTGTLVLSGANTYTGATNVNQGTLAVNGSLTATSSVTVANTATLQGSGTINSSVTIQSGGTLATGNSIESLGTGTLNLNNGSTFAYEMDKSVAIATGGDLTFITGDLNITAGAILTLTELDTLGSGSWDLGERLTLISYTGTWNNGLLTYLGSTLNDGGSLTYNGITWEFDYNNTLEGSNYTAESAGSFVTMTVTAIPEPGTALLGGLGLLLLFRRRRTN